MLRCRHGFALLAAVVLLAVPQLALAQAAAPLTADVAVCAPGAPCPVPIPGYFAQTGFRVDRPAFWDYFQRRGGVPVFGYPVSRTVRFLGFPTQFFQRQVMQLWPDGTVHLLNLLDTPFMPYTTFNYSTFPGPDPQVIAQAPDPADPAYGAKVVAFVRANAPDTWDGLPVNFARTYFGTVSPAVAFPALAASSPQVQALLPLVQLEVWGVPTSRPAHDPANRGFVYLRFQRGVMMYDVACSCTQGVLFGDYFKSILTGRNLPTDLAQEAAGSPFLGQYDPSKPNSVARPEQLPATDLTNAFTPEPIPLGSRDCGSFTVGGPRQAPLDAPAAQGTEGCFSAAIPACAPVSMTVTWMGVDAGIRRTFALSSAGAGCQVTDTAQPYMVPTRPNPPPAATYICAGVGSTPQGLQFRGCGEDGDILVPAP